MTDAEILVQMILVSTFAAAMIVIGIFGAMFFINEYFNKKEKRKDA
jgi:hypothetical protein